MKRVTPAFRVVAVVEAVSYLALLGAVVVHRAFDGPDGTSPLGMTHGIIFLAYVALTLKVRPEQGWNLWQTLLVIIAAAIPVGGFVVANRLVDNAARPVAT